MSALWSFEALILWSSFKLDWRRLWVVCTSLNLTCFSKKAIMKANKARNASNAVLNRLVMLWMIRTWIFASIKAVRPGCPEAEPVRTHMQINDFPISINITICQTWPSTKTAWLTGVTQSRRTSGFCPGRGLYKIRDLHQLWPSNLIPHTNLRVGLQIYQPLFLSCTKIPRSFRDFNTSQTQEATWW